jgi:hypothetical protein
VSGYRVEARRKSRLFRCIECNIAHALGRVAECNCLHDALAYSRTFGPGARVLRGAVILAITTSSYRGQIVEAENANRATKARAA